MAKKIEKEITRLELAEALESFARDVRSGLVSTDTGEWHVPENISAKFRLKEKKGRFEAKIRWRWSTIGDYTPEAKNDFDRWQTSLKSSKKQMTVAWKKIEKAVRDGAMPEAQAITDLIDSSKAFHRFAEPEWEEAMQEFLDHLENLERAVENKQIDVVAHEVRDLRAGMKACHRAFK